MTGGEHIINGDIEEIRNLLRMPAAIDRAISCPHDIVVNFHRLVILLSSIVHNTSNFVKNRHSILMGWPNQYLLRGDIK